MRKKITIDYSEATPIDIRRAKERISKTMELVLKDYKKKNAASILDSKNKIYD